MYKKMKKPIALLIIACFVVFPNSVYALPTGASGDDVSAGNVNLVYSGSQLDMTTTANTVTQWADMSLGLGEIWNIHQPNADSYSTNIDLGADPSYIYGNLWSNGKVILYNGNGVYFGPDAMVDVAGLIASTLEIDFGVTDFANDNIIFKNGVGSVINHGNIKINAPGGYAALLGTTVLNTGLIQADLGSVLLAAGEAMTLSLDPLGYISVVIDTPTDQNVDSKYAAANNVGTIQVDEGRVTLTADVLNNAFDSAVNNDGVIEAGVLEETNGDVVLRSNQNIELNGTIIASGTIDAYAEENIILGKPLEDTTIATFLWKYLRGDRSYLFKEFGYYTATDGSGPVVLSQGYDIGKDANSPTSGGGVVDFQGDPVGIYTIFDTGKNNQGIITYFDDPALNPDGLDHLDPDRTGTIYPWEDMYNNGDQDFNDAVIDFSEDLRTVEAPDALLQAQDIFLTANQGSISQQGGEIVAQNLMLETNTGVSGIGCNGGLQTNVSYYLSALNKGSGDLKVSNAGDLVIARLSGLAGLNEGVTGKLGVTNNAVGGKIDIEALEGQLVVDGPVNAKGDVRLAATSNIIHTEEGDVTIFGENVGVTPPINVHSTSHTPNVPSDNDTIDMAWAFNAPEAPEPYGDFVGEAGGEYFMYEGSQIVTHGGDASIEANGDVTLALVDADVGDTSVTSNYGDIIDGDGGSVPDDYDVIGDSIALSAPNGSIGDIDEGSVSFGFSYLFDNASSTDPDASEDAYSESGGIYSTSQTISSDGSWWFHILAMNLLRNQVSETVHAGPYLLALPVPPSGEPFTAGLWDDERVYYEILDPSKYLSFEPATKIGLYAYHPLTEVDQTAFDNIRLDLDAYDFINNNIDLKKKSVTAPYFGIE